jgi:hypothetical protein
MTYSPLSRLVDGRCYRYALPMGPAAQLRIVPVALVRPGRLFRPGRSPLRSARKEPSRESTMLSTIVNN